jgi:hypothetical protein
MPDGAPQNDENSEAGAIEAALRRFAFVYTVEIGPVRPGALAYERELAGRLALTALVVHRMHGRATVEDGVRVAWHQIADEFMLGTTAAVPAASATRSADALLRAAVAATLAPAPAFDASAWAARTGLWRNPCPINSA